MVVVSYVVERRCLVVHDDNYDDDQSLGIRLVGLECAKMINSQLVDYNEEHLPSCILHTMTR